MSAKAKNGHANIWDLFKLNFMQQMTLGQLNKFLREKMFSVLGRFDNERFRTVLPVPGTPVVTSAQNGFLIRFDFRKRLLVAYLTPTSPCPVLQIL
jgi:hypothetical protein